MFVCVPEPVWNTVNGNSSSHLPSTISSTTWAMSFAFSSVTAPHFALVKAHAFLTSASALICSIGMRWSPILKLLNYNLLKRHADLIVGSFLLYTEKRKNIIENDNKYQLDIMRTWLLPLYIFDLYL